MKYYYYYFMCLYLMIYILLCVSSLVAEDNGKLVTGRQENPVVLRQDLSTLENRQGVVSLPDGKFLVNTPSSKRIYAIQCGLDVTIFTLKYFNVNYSLPKVSIELPLSNSGISMKDIKQILQCYGLVTDARNNVTLNKIIQKIDYGTLAILPMQMGNGVNHYFIIMLNNDKKPILVNVSKGISVLNGSRSEKEVTKYNKLFADAGGVVLFVKKDKDKMVSISKTVKLNPDTIELGEFMVGGPESSNLINASFNLINTSDSPIMVSSVQASCGCTKMDWDGGILKAGEKKEVKFSVIPGAWGRGEQKKIARVSFVDGSTIDVTIHGTGQTPVERQRIELSQYSAIIEINDETNTEIFDVRLARLSSYVRPIQEIKMTSDVSWLTPELTDQEKKEDHETAELHARLSVQEIRSLLASGDNKLQGTLHISGNKEMEPVEMKIEIFQRDFYRLSQYLIPLSKNNSETIIIRIYPEKENDAIKILELKTETDFIVGKSDEVDGISAISIKLDSAKEIKTGYYTVTAKIKNAKGNQNLVRITINITE